MLTRADYPPTWTANRSLTGSLRGNVGTTRLETFADGVFAIAATLLILSVDIHIGSPKGPDLRHELLDAWPSYVAYAVSFLTMGIIWLNHHSVMNQIDRADRTFLVLTIGFLLVVAFIPLPTRLVAEYIGEEGARAATVMYGITLTLTAAMFNAIWFYAARGGRLLRADADERTVRGISKTFVLGPWIYLLVTVIAAIAPTVGAIGFLLFALFWVIESSIFGRERSGSLRRDRGA
jgi:TMEM175 potassium channel family protein